MRNRLPVPIVVVTAVLLAACSSSGASTTTWSPDQGGTTWSGTATTAASSFEGTTTTVYQDYPYPDVAFPEQDFNPPVDTDWDGVSTFALDVDTGSYSIARKFVLDGYLPDPDSVRVEEFVNYFQQDYTQPRWADGLAVTIDGSTTPFLSSPFDRIIRVGIQSAELPEELRRHAALTFVIDTSGSMEEGRRLELVKESLRMLVDELQSTDTVAVVAYNDNAHVILGPTAVEDRNSILDAIDSLTAGGSTNAEAGLALGYRLAADAYPRRSHQPGGACLRRCRQRRHDRPPRESCGRSPMTPPVASTSSRSVSAWATTTTCSSSNWLIRATGSTPTSTISMKPTGSSSRI